VSQETINLGTRGPRTFVQGHIVSGRPVTPLVQALCKSLIYTDHAFKLFVILKVLTMQLGGFVIRTHYEAL